MQSLMMEFSFRDFETIYCAALRPWKPALDIPAFIRHSAKSFAMSACDTPSLNHIVASVFALFAHPTRRAVVMIETDTMYLFILVLIVKSFSVNVQGTPF